MTRLTGIKIFIVFMFIDSTEELKQTIFKCFLWK